jgi:hypothetical protein
MAITGWALTVASRWFGPATVERVFEPLVADWQREFAAATSRREHARILINGSVAFALCVLTCLLTGGISMSSRAAIGRGTAVLIASTIVLLALQMALNSLQFALPYPLEWRMWIALPMVLPLAIPMALLPMMLILRGRLATARQAALMLAAGAMTAYLATALAPLTRGDVRDSLYEAMSQRALANDAAGRFQYPGTAMRMLRPTTPEQRAEFRHDRRYLEYQAEVTRPRFGRAAMLNGALAVALGALGWALAGLRRATPGAIVTWWAMAWVAIILMGGNFSYWVNGAGVRVGGAPRWLPLATFSLAAIVLMMAERRTRLRAN